MTVDKIFRVTRLIVLLYRYTKLHITIQKRADCRCFQLYILILTWQNPHQPHNLSKIPLPPYWLIVATLNILEMNLIYTLLCLFISECSTCQNEGIWCYSSIRRIFISAHLLLKIKHTNSKVLFILTKAHYTCNNYACNYFPITKIMETL